MPEYIKRDAVIDLITHRYENPEICTQEINGIPAADVAPVVHGRWEEADWLEYDAQSCGTIRYPKAAITCTNCRCAFKKDALRTKNYCPNCGAKMEGLYELQGRRDRGGVAGNTEPEQTKTTR